MLRRLLSDIPISVVFFRALIGITVGFQFGFANQSTYLAAGIRILDPEYVPPSDPKGR